MEYGTAALLPAAEAPPPRPTTRTANIISAVVSGFVLALLKQVHGAFSGSLAAVMTIALVGVASGLVGCVRCNSRTRLNCVPCGADHRSCPSAGDCAHGLCTCHNGLRVRSGALFAAVSSACQAFQFVFHNEYCGWLFRCGCVWQWAGGWDCCNVHNAHGPKCPWCMAKDYISWTTDCLVLALMVFMFHEVMDVCHTHQKMHARVAPRTLVTTCMPVAAAAIAAAAVFFAVGMLVAFIFKVTTGYPYFISGSVHGKHSGNSTK